MNVKIDKVKICVTIPKGKTDEVKSAMFRAGAGEIGGNYTECSTVINCIGTFKPGDSANPYIGEKNKLELVEEEKLEVICDIKKAKQVIIELRKAHPYEEPAIDIIPLIDEESLI